MESKLSNVSQVLQKIVRDAGETHAWQAMFGKTVEKNPLVSSGLQNALIWAKIWNISVHVNVLTVIRAWFLFFF